MRQYDQHHQIPVAYPPTTAAAATTTTSQAMAPPPVGYPTYKDADASSVPPTKSKTQSRGDGFWKGCCAALCCCCVLDACF